MIKVLQFVATVGSPGGVQSLLKSYYDNIDHSKVHFDFAVFDKEDCGFEHYFKDLGCKIYYVPPKKNGLKEHIEAIKKIFENEKYDIVHTHQNFRGLLTIYEAKKYKIPVRIVQSHRSNAPETLKIRIIRFFCTFFIKKMSTDWWACGKDAAIWMFGKRAYKSNRVFILNNAIDVTKFDYDEQKRKKLRQELNIEKNFVIGLVGRFFYQKNHKLLINIFEQLLRKNSDARLLLIGNGELENEIKELVHNKNMDDYVIFAGAKTNVSDYLQAMDVFVLTSYFEGLPIVLIEAQSAGLPCVTSRKITDEMKVTDLVHYVENYNNIDEWTKKIVNFYNFERKSYLNEMKSSNYYIKNEAKKLEKKYQERINR